DAPPQADRDALLPAALRGEWRLTGIADPRQTYPGCAQSRLTLADSGRVTLSLAGVVTNEGTAAVRPSKRGAGGGVDPTLPDAATYRGVDEWDGDGLAVCFAPAGEARPASLKPAAGQWVERWGRVQRQAGRREAGTLPPLFAVAHDEPQPSPGKAMAEAE